MEINKKIPFPGRKVHGTKYPFEKMKVGDSIQFSRDACKLGSGRTVATNASKKYQKKFKAGLHNHAVRIWRVD